MFIKKRSKKQQQDKEVRCPVCHRGNLDDRFKCKLCDADMVCQTCLEFAFGGLGDDTYYKTFCVECNYALGPKEDGWDQWLIDEPSSKHPVAQPQLFSTKGWPKVKYTPPPPIVWPREMKYSYDFYPLVDPEIYWQVTAELLNEQHNEIGGFGLYDQDLNRIVWAWFDHTAKMGPGSITMSSGEANTQCYLANRKACNVQFHTHPGFGAFFSGTDDRDQYNSIMDMASLGDDGFYIMFVIDRLAWKAVKFTWGGGTILSKESGHARVSTPNGELLTLDFQRSLRGANKLSQGNLILGVNHVRDNSREKTIAEGQLVIPASVDYPGQTDKRDEDPHPWSWWDR